jgi:hypothetical protein
VYFDDAVVTAVEELRGKSPKCKVAKFLSDNFSAIFEIQPAADSNKVADILGKLSLRPAVGYIGEGREAFASAARTAIYNYSEIDLTFHEINEIANGLVDLVYHKSKAPLSGVAPSEIQQRIGVSLDDLLEVLSISRGAYDALIKGAHSKALKTASLIQRWLKSAGADDTMIAYASQQKVDWDIWLRNARHIYTPFDLGVLLGLVDKLYDRFARSGADFEFLYELLGELAGSQTVKKFPGLSRELLFGAVGSVVVRRYSK